jgi:hypothetical protein
MKKFVLSALALFMVAFSFAQDTTVTRSTTPKRTALTRVGGNDHFMIQFGSTRWTGKPDSINTGGFSRSFNMYFMFAFPFKTNPKLGAAIGVGLGTDHIFFNKTRVGIADNSSTLRFQNMKDTNHFEKYKLATSYLEVPVELRFTSNPENDKKSFKMAIGAKVGLLLSAWVKGVTLQDRNDKTIQDYTMKEKSKRFFNGNRLSVTGRLGYGAFTGFVSYAITPLLEEGVGPTVRPMTIGLTISGL